MTNSSSHSNQSTHEAFIAGVQRFNEFADPDAVKALHTCCGSHAWAEAMADGRPYPGPDDLFRAADDTWFLLPHDEWLEAFSHHPRIGERNLNQPKFVATARQASEEQSGMAAASDAQRNEFAALNEQYERKFNHVFLICATGKTAESMLAQLRRRLNNDATTELHNAAREQARITRLRLERMLSA